jgi:dienelactone hydrolase
MNCPKVIPIEGKPMSQPAVPGFGPPRMVTGGDLTLPVYVSETGTRPLIILHELPGMSDSFLDYCRTMQTHGFRIYMPLLFKSPGTQMTNAQMARLCISYEFRRMFGRAGRRDGEQGLTRWLLDLVSWVGAENQGRDTGVIGMCLTGGFALAAIARAPVTAAVLCQPSYPFSLDLRRLGSRRNCAPLLPHVAQPCQPPAPRGIGSQATGSQGTAI